MSVVASTIVREDSKTFYLTKLAKLQPKWSHLRDNSGPSALKPTPFYTQCLKIITGLECVINNQSNFTYVPRVVMYNYYRKQCPLPSCLFIGDCLSVMIYLYEVIGPHCEIILLRTLRMILLG